VLSARRVAASLAFPTWAAHLAGPLDAVYAQTPTSSTCALVTTPSGATVYAHNPDLAVIPASNQKLLTAYVALDMFGAQQRYQTQLATDAKVTAGVVEGDVWLIGGGDPVLATPDYAASFVHQPQPFTDVTGLLQGLQAAGITRIRGALIADGSRYDDQRYPSSWPARFKTGVGENPSGPVSGLNLNDGFTTFPPSGQEFAGSGTRVAAANPPLAATETVAAMLRSNGIVIDGGVKPGKAVANTTVLAAVNSPPLGDIVDNMLRESDNTTAELLLKELGKVGAGQPTTADGARVVAYVLGTQGLIVPGMAIVDGSGLSDANRVTCTFLDRLLRAAGPDGPLAQGLPVAGKTGTLADRFAGTPGVGQVRAKTGTLAGVAALSGWADTLKGAHLVFAFVANEGDEEALKPVEDQLANVLLT
jgi:D-alanyl-D-alanine carboxypeptidase/D-alanyl-D-alanine-endopeptidase (penicillin-binding protein 4)